MGRLRGTNVLAHETTSQQCLDMAINHINGLSPNESELFINRLEQVTIADVQAAAQAIIPPCVTAIVANEEIISQGLSV
jgi:predicted Zn-dependent peptidase